jgi:glycosyltransferase involved in cell wall biosynthesis
MQVSIYLPTRNRAASLQRAVESVLAQSHADFELIVVDDGSSDGTRELLEAVQRRDARVRVIHHDASRGAPVARNAAIAASRGEWITGLDDDDEFLPRRLELLLAHARLLGDAGERYSAIFTQAIERTGPGQQQHSDKRGPVHFEDLFVSNVIGNQVFARRSMFEAIGGFDTTLPAWQDLDLLLRLTRRFGPARLLDVPLYVFDNQTRPDRISAQSKQRIVQACDAVLAKHPEAPARLLRALQRQVYSDFYGFALGPSDLWRCLSLGVDARALWWLARRLLPTARGAK